MFGPIKEFLKIGIFNRDFRSGFWYENSSNIPEDSMPVR